MNDIDDTIASLDDEFWNQAEIEQREMWERHEKALEALRKINEELSWTFMKSRRD